MIEGIYEELVTKLISQKINELDKEIGLVTATTQEELEQYRLKYLSKKGIR
jgi:hypothetical protein